MVTATVRRRTARPDDPAPGEARRRAEAGRLDERILEAIRRPWDAPVPEEELDLLARDLFLHQRRHNVVARGWWGSLGVDPRSVSSWREVPPLPALAWRSGRVAAFPSTGRAAPARFLSSGTTSASRSRVHLETLDLYEAAIRSSFRRHALPDRDRMRLLFLTPPPSRARHSSLVHMFGVLRRGFGAGGSAFFDVAGAPPESRHHRSARERDARLRLVTALRESEASGVPVFLLGPAFAFVHVLDALEAKGIRSRLPRGSRLFQTGGFKGRSREVSPADLLAGYRDRLGIEAPRVVNEYGMAELASQFYAGADARYAGPPWLRWRVLDPLTLEAAADGAPGVLAIWDLANRSSCFAIRTEDLAVARGRTLELLGRLPGAELRGCSLEADPESIAAARGSARRRRRPSDAPRD